MRARAFGLSLFVVAAVTVGLVGSPSVAYAPPGDSGDPYDRVVAEMYVAGVTNDNANPRLQDAIDLLAFTWGSSQTATHPKADPIVIVKPVDASSTQLYGLHLNGALLKWVAVYVSRTTPEGASQRYMEYCYASAQIAVIRPFDHGVVDDRILEEVTITARKASETYFTEGTTTGWDYRLGVPWSGHC